MYTVSNLSRIVHGFPVSRSITCTSFLYMSHYGTLGLTPAATQSDIKKAYFELCKKYHPDKNKGSGQSVKMFRSITEAYEVLGNEEKRRIYDRKMGYGSGMNHQYYWKAGERRSSDMEGEKTVRMNRKFSKVYTGKTWYYDFDAWKNAHYPDDKNNYINYIRQRTSSAGSKKNELIFPQTIAILCGLIGFFIALLTPTYFYTTLTATSPEYYREKADLNELQKRSNNREDK